jgi:hypothetical protein
MEEGLFAELLQALGRLVVERFRETAQEQTNDLLGGLAENLIGWFVQAVFLFMGIAARSLLLFFGPQVAFLQGILVGAPWELTAGLPEVQAITRVAQVASFALLPVAIAWSGMGYMASFVDGGSEGFAKRILGGAILVAFIPLMLDMSLRIVHALGMALAGGGETIPGYGSINQAVLEGIAVASAVTPPISGRPGGDLSRTMLSFAENETTAAGAIAFVYALAVVMGGAAAAVRIVVLDALYVLSPLAALCLATPFGAAIFSVWSRAWAVALLVVLPAGLILRLSAALLVRFSEGGPLWVALIGMASVVAYAVIVGRTGFGMALSAPATARRIVGVVATRGHAPAAAAAVAAPAQPALPPPPPSPAWGGHWPLHLPHGRRAPLPR